MQFMLVMKDRDSNVGKAASECKTISLHITSFVIDSWVILYGSSKCVLRNIGTQFVNKFFELQ